MLEPTSMEQLLVKALDGEPLSERELRDFGAAILESPEFAEDYVLSCRILREAARLPQAEPSPAFVGGVMEAVRQAPAPQAPRRANSSWAVAALALVALLIGAGVLGRPEWAGRVRGLLPGVESFLDALTRAWDGVRTLAASGLVTAKITALARSMAWLGMLLTLLALGLNIWSIHQMREDPGSRRMV
jgi:hypothetical protein